jgi:hypothetical protein
VSQTIAVGFINVFALGAGSLSLLEPRAHGALLITAPRRRGSPSG